MRSEPLVGGGKLVALSRGGVGAEAVPGAKRGLVVQSASIHAGPGPVSKSGRYRLTRRVIAGTDLWHVRRLKPAEFSADGR